MAKKKPIKKTDTNRDSRNKTLTIGILILSCFFISGLTGLIYQILWTRMIVKIVGGAPFAVSIILTVFMGGLGLGSYIASRYIDRVRDPLKLIRIYGILEIIVGGYALILPVLLFLFRPIYKVIYNNLFAYFWGYNLITFVGCFLLLIIPVTCMGATLPVLSRFFITRISRVGTHIGRLYGLNTFGAAAGSLFCGFWLISSIGVWGSLAVAVALNGIIGIVCIVTSRNESLRAKAPDLVTEDATRSRKKDKTENNLTGQPQGHRVFALVIFSISGFCAMAYEVIWTKLLGLIVGPTTYSFTIVLVTFITGLALGSLFFGRFGDRANNVLKLLITTQIAAAFCALLVSQLMGNSQIFFAKLIFQYKDHFALLNLLKAAVLFLFMFLPTFFLGATFPLVGKIYTRSLSQTGRSIGFAYAINSLGAVLGSFCAGFLIIPLIGKEQGLSLVVVAQILTALVIGGLAFFRSGERILRWAPLAFVAVLGLALSYPYPHWNRKMLSIGKYHRFDNSEIVAIGWLKALFAGTGLYADHTRGDIVFFGDGIGGFTTVLKADIDILGNEGYAMYNSGKADASSRLDMDTQTLSAHLPMLFHENPEDVLVIGLASGVTAGEILHFPIERLDVVEINNQVVTASDFFIPWNNDVLTHPKTELIIQDARAHLQLSNRKYDVISSEPSNPWMAGLATLFTRDFFSLAKSRLKEDGIYVQFIHTYQMDWSTFALVGRTFESVFPNSKLVMTNPSSLGPDFLLIGFNGKGGLVDSVAKRNLIYASQSKNMTLNHHRVYYHLVVSEDLGRLFGKGNLNTDNWPRLEYSAPKLLHYADLTIPGKIWSRRWLSPGTVKILKEDLSNVDTQIALAEYAIKVIRPEMAFNNPVDLYSATPSQKDRFLSILDRYCSENVITNFELFDNDELKSRCVSVQMETVHANLRSNQDKGPLYLQLGALTSEIGDLDSAERFFLKATQLDPTSAHALFNLGSLLERRNKTTEAIETYSNVLEKNPYYIDALNNLAWILATNSNTALRDGDKAIGLAEKACKISGDKDPFHLDTLAAAYAEAGRYDLAQSSARLALDLARRNGYDYLARDITQRIKLYRLNQPFYQ